MKNTQEQTAKEALKLVVLIDKAQGRLSYGELSDVAYHTKHLVIAISKLRGSAIADGFTPEEADSIMNYYRYQGEQEAENELKH